MMYYAIRERDTDNYLPDRPKSRRGHSFSTPTPTAKAQPRLFPTRTRAQIALSHWLKGEYHCHRSWDGEEEDLKIVPKPDRQADKMEIVPVSLELP